MRFIALAGLMSITLAACMVPGEVIELAGSGDETEDFTGLPNTAELENRRREAAAETQPPAL